MQDFFRYFNLLILIYEYLGDLIMISIFSHFPQCLEDMHSHLSNSYTWSLCLDIPFLEEVFPVYFKYISISFTLSCQCLPQSELNSNLYVKHFIYNAAL